MSFNGYEEGEVPKIVVPETLFDDQVQIANEISAVRKLNVPAPRVTDSWRENREMNPPVESANEQITRDESGQHEMRLLEGVERIADALERLADHFAPRPADIVGTPYVARNLACTTVWITEMKSHVAASSPALATGKSGICLAARSTNGSRQDDGQPCES
ncbi:MAG: hypothetical protein O2955_17305 [Planctomycetota bacterium]|nr:hypothetical protein [Planctomycetota bacterium]